MKFYTPEEKAAALKNLPRPTIDFLGSVALVNLYTGIYGKLNLNLRQMGIVNTIVNATLMGLEPEHALEHNLHQELPELSNEKTRELVGDISDRIFKEAKRRLRENILMPEESWDEGNLGPQKSYQPFPRGSELLRRVEAEKKAGGFKPPEEEKPAPTEPETPPVSVSVKTSPQPEPRALSVVEQKLAAPTVAAPEKVQVPSSASGVQNIEKPEPPRKADPYREQVD